MAGRSSQGKTALDRDTWRGGHTVGDVTCTTTRGEQNLTSDPASSWAKTAHGEPLRDSTSRTQTGRHRYQRLCRMLQEGGCRHRSR